MRDERVSGPTISGLPDDAPRLVALQPPQVLELVKLSCLASLSRVVSLVCARIPEPEATPCGGETSYSGRALRSLGGSPLKRDICICKGVISHPWCPTSP